MSEKHRPSSKIFHIHIQECLLALETGSLRNPRLTPGWGLLVLDVVEPGTGSNSTEFYFKLAAALVGVPRRLKDITPTSVASAAAAWAIWPGSGTPVKRIEY